MIKEEDYERYIVWNISLVMFMATAFLLMITLFSFELMLRGEYVIIYIMILATFMITFSTLYLVFFMKYLKKRRVSYIKIKTEKKTKNAKKVE